MFNNDQLKYVDVVLLCEILGIETEDIMYAFSDRIDEHWDEISELFDREV